ncbi:MAG: prepilin peptidase [Solobacterium sp.]|nr:prepilin peptidase [Solobacterium sp.]
MSLALFDPWMRVVLLVFTFLLGSVFASFFACVGGRIASKRDWVKERSICESCGHELSPRDLVPVFSYLCSRGKCRYCGAKIPISCLIYEVVLGLYWVIALFRFGVSIETLRCMGLSGLLLGLSVVDLEIYEIPDGFILAGIIFWAITAPFMPGSLLAEVKRGLIGGLSIGGGMLVLSLIFDRIVKKDSLGGGDIKLFFMTGLYMGALTGFFNLILSCLVGLVFVVLLKKSKIPFGPSISIATCISMLWGSMVVFWYLGLFL